MLGNLMPQKFLLNKDSGSKQLLFEASSVYQCLSCTLSHPRTSMSYTRFLSLLRLKAESIMAGSLRTEILWISSVRKKKIVSPDSSSWLLNKN